MRSAFEKDASFPVLLALADAGSMCAIAVGGVSSRRKRPRKPPVFFFSFSDVASGAAACCGGAHSLVRVRAASFARASCCGAGTPQVLVFGGGSLGFAVGAHSFAGASFEAGGAVIHDSAGAPWVAPWAGTPPPGARHQLFSFDFASCVCGAAGRCGGALAAGPGAKRPDSEESRSSTAGGTSTPGTGV